MEKDDKYHRINEKSKVITDALGCGIDNGIRIMVVLLNYNNIITRASCWGHTNWGLPYPWIDVNNNCSENLQKIINGFDLEIEPLGKNLVRLTPTDKSLNGRKSFNELKKKLLEL